MPYQHKDLMFKWIRAKKINRFLLSIKDQPRGNFEHLLVDYLEFRLLDKINFYPSRDWRPQVQYLSDKEALKLKSEDALARPGFSLSVFSTIEDTFYRIMIDEKTMIIAYVFDAYVYNEENEYIERHHLSNFFDLDELYAFLHKRLKEIEQASKHLDRLDS